MPPKRPLSHHETSNLMKRLTYTGVFKVWLLSSPSKTADNTTREEASSYSEIRTRPFIHYILVQEAHEKPKQAAERQSDLSNQPDYLQL